LGFYGVLARRMKDDEWQKPPDSMSQTALAVRCKRGLVLWVAAAALFCAVAVPLPTSP